MTWYSVNESGTWCNACGHMLARQLVDYDGEECPACGFPEDAEKMADYFMGDDDADTGECWNCGGEGFIADCFDGFCEDAESGCDDCTRPCPECRPRKPNADGDSLRQVLADALQDNGPDKEGGK